jgi:hypothetical protein
VEELIAMNTKQLEEEARSLPEAELRIRVATKISTSEPHIFAKMELERRERRRNFWGKTIVAWLALAGSLFSIWLSWYWHKP